MSIIRRLFWPVFTCLLLLYPAWHLEDLLRELSAGAANQAILLLRYAVGIGLWLAGAWLLNELIHILIWDRLIERYLAGRPVPGLLKHIITILVFLLAATGICGFVFQQSVTGIWATSGVLGLVFGFAARSLISDLFSGIAMHLDPPFRIGDWIEWQDGGEELLARVEQVNWRSTRVHARDDAKTIFIPNSTLSTSAVTNVFAPLGRTRQTVTLTLDSAVDIDRATRVLLSGLILATGPLSDPAPEVLLERQAPAGLVFLLRYWIHPSTSAARVRSDVLYSVLRALSGAGIRLGSEKREVLIGRLIRDEMEVKDARWILRRVEIFQAFDDSEISSIAEMAVRHELKAGATIVRQGAPGNSLYFVVEGILDVLISSSHGQDVRVNRLSPGEYFGEMSLLTGDPRSATIVAATGAVVYEVAKEVLEPILFARPEVTQSLADKVAARQLHNQARLAGGKSPADEISPTTFAAQLLSRIRKFFFTSAVA